MEQVVNLALCQRLQSALPASVKPALPPVFLGKMDGTTVSKFVHQLDVYFDMVNLKARNTMDLGATVTFHGH